MFIDSYQVEVQNLVTEKWEVDQSFRPQYKWQRVTRRLLCGFLRWTRQQIIGDPLVQALIVKTDAHQHARRVMRERHPRHVRIVRVEREGSRIVKYAIWRDGKWLE